MTATPGSAAPMASEVAPGRVMRFGATERRLHTIHASAFVVMFGTGLVLYLPVLATGHVWIALSRCKLLSVEGILRGTVPAALAAQNHPKWQPRTVPAVAAPRPGVVRLAAAAVVVGLGIGGLVGLVFT